MISGDSLLQQQIPNPQIRSLEGVSKYQSEMGLSIWAFSAILAATLFSHCSFSLTEDGKPYVSFISVDFFFWVWIHFVCVSGLTLLEIKTTLNDTKNVLANWSPSDESPCKWTGISCHPQDSRVSSMYVASQFIPISLHFLDTHLLKFVLKSLAMFFRGFSSNLPFMQLAGIISPSIGKLSRLQRL